MLRLPDAEIRRALDAMRRDTPRLESAARQLLLQILRESEPAKGSAAHERWQLAVTLQELALAELQAKDPSPVLERLSALAQGPIWEEVRRMARLTPGTIAQSRQVDAAIGANKQGGGGAPARVPESAVHGLPWSWPTFREAVPAAVIALIVLLAARGLGVLPVQALSHITDAYQIDAIAASGATPRRLQLRISAGAPSSVPRRVALFQDGTVFRDSLALNDSGSVGVPLATDDAGHYYQVRAALPDGNLALSSAVWIPSDRLLPVLIDALPWANVTIAGANGPVAAQPTPFSAALEPGVYRLHFENGGVTPSMDQEITVASPNQVFRFTMPGFDPDRTAAELAGATQTAR
jgi:hypothetical protein